MIAFVIPVCWTGFSRPRFYPFYFWKERTCSLFVDSFVSLTKFPFFCQEFIFFLPKKSAAETQKLRKSLQFPFYFCFPFLLVRRVTIARDRLFSTLRPSSLLFGLVHSILNPIVSCRSNCFVTLTSSSSWSSSSLSNNQTKRSFFFLYYATSFHLISFH